MSVDKFGRHSDSVKMKGAKGPPGEGFKLTSDGNYDIENKKLCNVGKASNDGDAVNLELLKEKSGSKLGYFFVDKAKTKRAWNARKLRIHDIASPQEATDAVNLKLLMDRTIHDISDDQNWDWKCRKRRLIDVSDPVNDLDAVNKQTLERNLNGCLKVSEKSPPERVWDALNNIISNVGNPVDNQDE